MRRLLIVVVIILSTSMSAHAKLYVTVLVSVSDEKVKQALQEGMEARINSTERYTISSSPVDANLFLATYCIVLEHVAGFKNEVVCHSEVVYFPFRGSLISLTLEGAGGIAVSGPGSTEYIVNSAINHFINGTTDAILAERKLFLKKAVVKLCMNEPSECVPSHDTEIPQSPNPG